MADKIIDTLVENALIRCIAKCVSIALAFVFGFFAFVSLAMTLVHSLWWAFAVLVHVVCCAVLIGLFCWLDTAF